MWNFKSTGRVKTVDSQNPNVQGNVETYRSLTQAEYDELSYEEKHSGIVYFITDGATDHIAASSIRYDNSGTHIASTSVQGAIDALDAMLGAIGDGDLSELESIISSAEVVLDEVQPILPTSSGTTGQVLTKTASGADWQDATGGGGNVDAVNGIAPDSNKNVQIDVELTQAEYNALPTSKNSDNINYYITDGIASESSINLGANAIAYNNTTSGLTATNAQAAIDELAGSSLQMDTLWENPSSERFDPQSIEFNYDNYSLLLICYHFSVEDSDFYTFSILLPVFLASSAGVIYLQGTGRNNNSGGRIMMLNDSGAMFQDAYYNGNLNNNYIIPSYIIGIK